MKSANGERRDLMAGKKKAQTSNRGKDPSTITKMMLCARAGGRCQFDGCNKKLFIDGITLRELNNSNIAHIVASAPDGPRGNDDSYVLSDKIENLMLMCQEHHKLIDENPSIYTISSLQKMKEEQEIKIEELLDEMNYPKSEVVMLESPIKGSHVSVDFKQAIEAIRSEGNNPASNHGVSISLKTYGEYRSAEYWNTLEKELIDSVTYQIYSLYRRSPNIRLSIFPLAPIPLIIKLGELLGDKRKIDIYQKFREPDTWQWRSVELLNGFSTEKIKMGDGNKTAVIISISSEIDISRVTAVDNFDVIYHLKAQRCWVNAIQSIKDLEAFWQEYLQILDRIKNGDKGVEICLFPAIPVSAAFEIGRRFMPGVYPKIRVFDEYDGFFETLTIGGNQ